MNTAGGISVFENIKGTSPIGGVNITGDTSTTTSSDTTVQHVRPLTHPELPYDILVDVFSYLHSSKDFNINIPTNLSNIFPWNCSQVCSSWKAVVDSIPGLWTQIAIDFKRWSNYEGHINLVNAILSRQPESLISLTITPGRDNFLDAYAIKYITTHFLNAHSNRFRYLRFNKGHHFKSFLAQPPGSTKNLETLNWTLNEEVRNVSVLRDAPSLRKVSIDLREHSLYFLQFDFLDLPLPWSQLTHIHFPGSLFSPAHAFALLRQSVNLQDCHLGVTALITKHSLDSITTVITLPALKIFVVEDRNFKNNGVRQSSEIPDLLKLLNLPNLVDFGIYEDYGNKKPSIKWSDLTFIEFIRRCSSLRGLVIHETVPSRYMKRLLRSAPKLVRLSIPYGREVPTTVLRRMSDPDYLPDLTNLHCCIIDLDTFVDMLEARWSKPSSPLQGVCITLDRS